MNVISMSVARMHRKLNNTKETTRGSSKETMSWIPNGCASVSQNLVCWGGALRDDTKNGCVADYSKLHVSAFNF